MSARVLPFRAPDATEVESPRRLRIAVLPGERGERLTIHRLGDRESRFELVWERHAEGVGWYTLRSVTLTADQARGLGDVLGRVDRDARRPHRGA